MQGGLGGAWGSRYGVPYGGERSRYGEKKARWGAGRRLLSEESVVVGEVRVAAEGLFVGLEECPELFVRDAALGDGALGLFAHGLDHVVGLVLHVFQDFRHAVALDDVGDRVARVAEL